ncbi:MAG TPA: fructose-6-phosphate aldolase [bacterium]|nr:fructose-6-phosphate aldolase [bacterium]
MKFFIDTANIEEIQDAASLGILDGVTTNPTLLAKEKGKGDFKEILKRICEIVQGPVSAEVVGSDADTMVEEGRKLAKIDKHIVIKVPLTREGLKAIGRFKREDIKTNATLVFSANQAILAAKAGASFLSPFVGRLDDASHYGMDLIKQIVTIFDNYDFQTEVIVASVRNPLHVVDAALMGADVVTIPFKVIELMIRHPLTDAGIKSFLADWQKLGAKI